MLERGPTWMMSVLDDMHRLRWEQFLPSCLYWPYKVSIPWINFWKQWNGPGDDAIRTMSNLSWVYSKVADTRKFSDPWSPFYLASDASVVETRAVLLEKRDGELRPIELPSKRFSFSQVLKLFEELWKSSDRSCVFNILFVEGHLLCWVITIACNGSNP